MHLNFIFSLLMVTSLIMHWDVSVDKMSLMKLRVKVRVN